MDVPEVGSSTMKAFRIDGEFEISRRNWQRFSKEITADDAEKAKEKILCDLGSRHRLARRGIRIRKVKELKSDDVIDLSIRYRIGAD